MCQLKPMEVMDVTPLERGYGRGGYGCRTQIRLGQLRPDGYHVQPSFCGVIFRMYACAILGVEVPCPTPDDAFVPTSVRRRWEAEWPRLESEGRAHIERHGWRR